jgi:hypothetical protein
MDERILESTTTMKRSHPSIHASGRSCKRRLVRVTSLELYDRACTQAVVRLALGRKSHKPMPGANRETKFAVYDSPEKRGILAR